MEKFNPSAVFAARKSLGLSRRELSEASGVSMATIYRVEKYGNPVLVGTWEALTTTLERMKSDVPLDKKAARKK